LRISSSNVRRTAQRNGLKVQRDLARFEARNREQVFDQIVQPVRMPLDRLQKAARGLGIILRAVEQRFDVAFDQRQRRAQFMADVRDEFAARVLELPNAREIVEDENGARGSPSRSSTAAALTSK
jgi:hypothetical protein